MCMWSRYSKKPSLAISLYTLYMCVSIDVSLQMCVLSAGLAALRCSLYMCVSIDMSLWMCSLYMCVVSWLLSYLRCESLYECAR